MSNMRIKNMFLLVTGMIVVFLLGCSYQFSTPPFDNDELTNIGDTKFGKEILEVLTGFVTNETTSQTGLDITTESTVYEISDDFLIDQQFNDDDSTWSLTVWTKNNHHIIGCQVSIYEDFDTESFQNSSFESLEGGNVSISGQKEELKEIAIKLALTTPKLCYAFPYADASQISASPAEKIVKEIVEVIKEVEIIKEVEVIKEVPVEVIKEVTVEKQVPSSGGCMNSQGNSTIQTSASNLFLLIGPLLLLIFYRLYRKYHQ